MIDVATLGESASIKKLFLIAFSFSYLIIHLTYWTKLKLLIRSLVICSLYSLIWKLYEGVLYQDYSRPRLFHYTRHCCEKHIKDGHDRKYIDPTLHYIPCPPLMQFTSKLSNNVVFPIFDPRSMFVWFAFNIGVMLLCESAQMLVSC